MAFSKVLSFFNEKSLTRGEVPRKPREVFPAKPSSSNCTWYLPSEYPRPGGRPARGPRRRRSERNRGGRLRRVVLARWAGVAEVRAGAMFPAPRQARVRRRGRDFVFLTFWGAPRTFLPACTSPSRTLKTHRRVCTRAGSFLSSIVFHLARRQFATSCTR